MNTVYKVIAGVGMIIVIGLVLGSAKETTSIINSISSNAIDGIKVLKAKSV